MKNLNSAILANISGGTSQPSLVGLYLENEDFFIKISAEEVAKWPHLEQINVDMETTEYVFGNIKNMSFLLLTIDESNQTYKIYRVIEKQ